MLYNQSVTMTKFTLHFLPVSTPTVKRTKRDAELTDAEAKAHVRRSLQTLSRYPEYKAHAHSKAGSRSVLRLKGGASVNLSIYQALSRLHQLTLGQKQDIIPAAQGQIPQRRHTNVPPTIGDSDGCDPFIRFPSGTGPLEHKLFHFRQPDNSALLIYSLTGL